MRLNVGVALVAASIAFAFVTYAQPSSSGSSGFDWTIRVDFTATAGKTAAELAANLQNELGSGPEFIDVETKSGGTAEQFTAVFKDQLADIFAMDFKAFTPSQMAAVGIVSIAGGPTPAPPVPPGQPTPAPPPTPTPQPQTFVSRVREIEAFVSSSAVPLSPLPDNCTATWLTDKQSVIAHANSITASYTATQVWTPWAAQYASYLDMPFNVTETIATTQWALNLMQGSLGSITDNELAIAFDAEMAFFAARATVGLGLAVNSTPHCFFAAQVTVAPLTPAPTQMPAITVNTQLYEAIELGAFNQPQQGIKGCPLWIESPSQYPAQYYPPTTTDSTVIAEYYLTYKAQLPPDFITTWILWNDHAVAYMNSSRPTIDDINRASTYTSVIAAVKIFRATLSLIKAYKAYPFCFFESSTNAPGVGPVLIGGDGDIAAMSQLLYLNAQLRASPLPASCPSFMTTDFNNYMLDATAVKSWTDSKVVTEYLARWGSYFPNFDQTKFLAAVATAKAALAAEGSDFPIGPSFPSGSNIPISGSDSAAGNFPPSGSSSGLGPASHGSMPQSGSISDFSGSGNFPTEPPSQDVLNANALAKMNLMRQTLGWNETVLAYPTCFTGLTLTLPPVHTAPPGLPPVNINTAPYLNYQDSLYRENYETAPAGCPSWVTNQTELMDRVTAMYEFAPVDQVVNTYVRDFEPRVMALYGGSPLNASVIIAWDKEATAFKLGTGGHIDDLNTYTTVEELVGIFRITLALYNITVRSLPNCFGFPETLPPEGAGSGPGHHLSTSQFLHRMMDILATEARGPASIPLPASCPLKWLTNTSSPEYTNYLGNGNWTIQMANMDDNGVIDAYVAAYGQHFGPELNAAKLKANLTTAKQQLQQAGSGWFNSAGSFNQPSGGFPSFGSSFSFALSQLGSQMGSSMMGGSSSAGGFGGFSNIKDAVAALNNDYTIMAELKVMKQTLSYTDIRQKYPQCFSNQTVTMLPAWLPNIQAYGLINAQYRRLPASPMPPGCLKAAPWINTTALVDARIMNLSYDIPDNYAIEQYRIQFYGALQQEGATYQTSVAKQWNNAAVGYFNGSLVNFNTVFLRDKYQLVTEAVQLFKVGLAMWNITKSYPNCFGEVMTFAPDDGPVMSFSDYGDATDPNLDTMINLASQQVRALVDPLPAAPTCPMWMQNNDTYLAMIQSGNITVQNLTTDAAIVSKYISMFNTQLPHPYDEANFTKKLADARVKQAQNPFGGLGFGSGSLPSFSGSGFPGLSGLFGSGSGLPAGFTSSMFGSGSTLPDFGSSMFGSGSTFNFDPSQFAYLNTIEVFNVMKQTLGFIIARQMYPQCYSNVIPTFAPFTPLPAPPVETPVPATPVTPAPVAPVTPLPPGQTAVPATPAPTSVPMTPLPPGQTAVPATPAPPAIPVTPLPPGQTAVPATPAPPVAPATPLPPGQTAAPATPVTPVPTVPATPLPPGQTATPAPPATPLPPGQTMTPITPVPTFTVAPFTFAPVASGTFTPKEFTATLDTGATVSQLRQKLVDMGIPSSQIQISTEGLGSNGAQKVSFSFTGADAGALSEEVSAQAASLPVHDLQSAPINGDDDDDDDGSNLPMIIGIAVGAVVLLAVAIGVGVKMSGNKNEPTHENFDPQQQTQFSEELINRTDSQQRFGALENV